MVLLYIAGHGKVGIAEEMFYFVPVDGRDADLRDTGVNTAMIAEALRNLPARRIVLIIVVSVGGAIEALSKIGVVKAQVEEGRSEHETKMLGHEQGVGVHLVAATLPLSYAVGLVAGGGAGRNRVDGAEAAGLVTAEQLSAFVKAQLPATSEHVTRFRQVPLADSIGLDSP